MASAKRTFPDPPERPMAAAELSPLVKAAITAAHARLRGTAPPPGERTVFRPTSNGWESRQHPFPIYFASPVREEMYETRRLPEVKSLIDFLWSHGACQKTFTRDDGTPPDRDAWDLAVTLEMVCQPLVQLVERSAFAGIVDTGKFTAWALSPDDLDEGVADIVSELALKRIRVRATCPVSAPSLAGRSWNASSDIVMRELPTRDLCIFLSHHGDEFLWNDFIFGTRTVVEITADIDVGRQQNTQAIALVSAALDLAKWSLSVATDSDHPLAEAPAIIVGSLRRRIASLRRGTLLGRGMTNLEDSHLTRASQLITRFRNARTRSDELDEAVWLFGRTCVAPLSRDVLLDSVVGLEGLLVAGPGESTYKFGLHGVAIIGDSDPVALSKRLRKLYEGRSKIAHGTRQADLDKMAVEARKLLATTIERIVGRVEAGDLRLDEDGGDVGLAVTHFVLRRVAGQLQL